MLPTSLTSAQLNGILGIADDAIICIDSRHRIILFNQGAERLFGWSAAEAAGRPLELLIPQRFHAVHGAHIAAFERSGATARQMAERRAIFGVRKDGAEFPAEASVSRLAADDGMIYTVILRDISARLAHERELRQAKEAAEAAMRSKSMFLANMSHELRTPLNAVIGMTSLLLDSGIDTAQRDCAETIRSSSEVLLATINDILDYSKIDLDKLEIEQRPFDLRRCIEESLDLLAPAAAEKGINLAYELADGAPAALAGDATRLRQVLVNLLSNAIKFTHHGEVLVTASALASGSGHEATFAVRDSGIGIAAERLPELFESFTQADASTTRKYGGTGLGLTIGKRLAEAMGGRMWVDSAPGAGSTFSFTILAGAAGTRLAGDALREGAAALAGRRILVGCANASNRRIIAGYARLWGMVPAEAAPAAARQGQHVDVAIVDAGMDWRDGAHGLPLVMLASLGQPPRAGTVFAAALSQPVKPAALRAALLQALRIGAPRPPAGAEPLASLAATLPLKILVAEDNAINQKVVQLMLERLGYRADLVASGAEALDALARQHYDLVLMDVQMPRMDGIEATRRLRARAGAAGGPRIVAMTANAMPGDREACLAAGMDAYLPKPVELAALRAVLAAVMGAPPAPGPDVPVIDRGRIAQMRALEDADNPTLVADIAAMFLDDAPRHLATLGQALRAGDCAQLAAAAHRFLSAIGNLGVQRMQVHCAELERRACEGALDGAGAVLDALAREFGPVRALLEAGLPGY